MTVHGAKFNRCDSGTMVAAENSHNEVEAASKGKYTVTSYRCRLLMVPKKKKFFGKNGDKTEVVQCSFQHV